MITTKQMTVERWVSLLRHAGVKDTLDIRVAVAQGPLIVEQPSAQEPHHLVVVDAEHYEHMCALWPEVIKAFE